MTTCPPKILSEPSETERDTLAGESRAVAGPVKSSSPSRRTLSEIAALSSGEEEAPNIIAFTRYQKPAREEETSRLSRNNAKEYKQKIIVLSDSESEEDIPIAQIAASLSSAASTPQLQQDLATMQLDPMPPMPHKRDHLGGLSNQSVVVAKSSQASSISRKGKESIGDEGSKQEALNHAKRQRSDNDMNKHQEEEEEESTAAGRTRKDIKRQKRAAKQAEMASSDAMLLAGARTEREDRGRKQMPTEQEADYSTRKVKRKEKRKSASIQSGENDGEQEQSLQNKKKAKKKEKSKDKQKEKNEKREKKKEKVRQKERKEKKKEEDKKKNQRDDRNSSGVGPACKKDAEADTASSKAEVEIIHAEVTDGKLSPPGKGAPVNSTMVKKDVQMATDPRSAAAPSISSLKTIPLAKRIPVLCFTKYLSALGFETMGDLSAVGVPVTKEAYRDLYDMIATLDLTKLNKAPATNPISKWAQTRKLSVTLLPCHLF